MSSEVEFQVGEHAFKLSPLKLEQQMRGWSIVGGMILPAIASSDGTTFDLGAIYHALKGVDRIHELFELFAANSKVQWQDKGYVPLKTFADNVFARRSDLTLGYLAECVWHEYSSFLDERGKSVLSTAASRFTSLMG